MLLLQMRIVQSRAHAKSRDFGNCVRVWWGPDRLLKHAVVEFLSAPVGRGLHKSKHHWVRVLFCG